MRKVAVIVNCSSEKAARVEHKVRALRRALRARGISPRIYRTAHPAMTAPILEKASREECDAVLAAGGDGTFNDLLHSAVDAGIDMPLGVFPMGSGNILAQELGLGHSVERIATRIARGQIRRIAVGKLTAHAAHGLVTRYFSVAAGVGADARVICGIRPELKARFGIGAYYMESARQLLLSFEPLPRLQVRFRDDSTGEMRVEVVCQAVAERVSYFGRCLVGRNGHGLHTDAFRLLLLKTQSRAALIAYGSRLLATRLSFPPGPVRDVEIAHTQYVEFAPVADSSAPVLAEVDGEFVGQAPASAKIVPQALRILIPGEDDAAT